MQIGNFKKRSKIKYTFRFSYPVKKDHISKALIFTKFIDKILKIW